MGWVTKPPEHICVPPSFQDLCRAFGGTYSEIPIWRCDACNAQWIYERIEERADWFGPVWRNLDNDTKRRFVIWDHAGKWGMDVH